MEYIDKAVKPYILHRIVVGILCSIALTIYLIKKNDDSVYTKDPKTGNKIVSKGAVAFYIICLTPVFAFLDLYIGVIIYGLSGGR
jgi:hypothetical protein